NCLLGARRLLGSQAYPGIGGVFWERRHPCLLSSVTRTFLSHTPHPKGEQARMPALPGDAPRGSEDQLQSELDLARINPSAVDHAVIGRPELRAWRAPDRVVRKIEDLRSEFNILRFGQIEFLIGRSVEADDARTDDRISRGVPKAEIPGGGS